MIPETYLSLITAPEVEPVELEDLKWHRRVSYNGDDGASMEDDLIQEMITAAREYVELQTGRALITQTWKQTVLAKHALPWYDPVVERYFLGRDGIIYLRRWPIQSVVSVAVDGTVVDPSTYTAQTGNSNPFVKPVANYWTGRRIDVQCVAGYGDTGDTVPSSLIQCIKQICGALYENRESQLAAPALVANAMTDALIQNYTLFFSS